MYFYKAVPKQFLQAGGPPYDRWTGIKEGGLDPKRAGCIGGATTMSLSVRKATVLDKDYTWLSADKGQPRSYAVDKFAGRSPVILQIVIPDFWKSHGMITDHGTAGWGTGYPIPPYYIYFESGATDRFIPIESYNGRNAFVTTSSSDSDSDWE